MKKATAYIALLFMIITTLSSFHKTPTKTTAPPTEFELLVEYLESNGNFVNSNLAPALIAASEIKDHLKNKNYLVLDIRSKSWFEYGHIKNAQNVEASELLNYFETKITPSSYEKITIVCYSGQSAAYYTSLLRLYGYDNVYNLKWGMSSWDEELAANIWVKNSKNDFAEQLETTPNNSTKKSVLPTITTGKIEGKDILKTRIKELFTKPYREFIVKSEDAFKNPENYYIVHYVNKEIYNFGHLKGAINYEPNKSLASTTDLYTLPTTKKILINCITGQSAAYAVAYLNVLGYDASNLAYGSNSYMNAVLTEKGWNGFSSSEISNFPIVE